MKKHSQEGDASEPEFCNLHTLSCALRGSMNPTAANVGETWGLGEQLSVIPLTSQRWWVFRSDVDNDSLVFFGLKLK